ncbi:galactose-1-phosphate uridyl transferase [Mycena floridula]|nr:galactose-1-phosphate uridyl transferase [Mycena floridula]
MEFAHDTHSHRRYNPLTDEHILVSPHRNKRPWLGQNEVPQTTDLSQYDPSCYLCPGNERAGGLKNEDYQQIYVFANDYAAVLPAPMPSAPTPPHPMLTLEPVSGGCDVMVFHRRHDLTLAQLEQEDIERVIAEWIKIYKRRGSQESVKYVQIFENKGSIMGCSNPHPHCQIWSLSSVPTIPAKELASMKAYSDREATTPEAPHGPGGKACLLCEYAHAEVTIGERVVVKNDHFIALVPWWATWPFEILLLPYKRHIAALDQLTEAEKPALAEVLSKITKRYDNLFQCSFAYSMGLHQRPTPGDDSEDEGNLAHLHFHFSPPLLRSATVKKFLVGFELMAEAQRDITPEQAANRLKACSEVHYLAEK